MSSYRAVCDRIRAARLIYPDATALSHAGATMSYAKLDERADQFAGYLAQLGVTSATNVAICMERSPEWIVAALAILRTGASYVPLDPAWPDSRVLFALEDSGATALVSSAALRSRIVCDIPSIDPLRDADAIAAAAAKFETQPPNDAASVAYTIYTSGSTGAPKGVEITHANLSHLIDWHLDAFGVTARDCASHLAGLGFDAAVWEIWPTLCAGACLCLPDEAVRLSPELMQQWIVSQGITVSFVPTVNAAALIAMEWPLNTKLRFLLTGGDALPHGPSHPLPFSVVNNYGPTECTVVATSGFVRVGSTGAPTLGHPIAGTSVYLLDSEGRRVADNEIGEMYIGGNGVGRGYRNLAEATRTSFLPDPFSGVPGARMYKTGDCGLQRADGEIEFHGRLDRQVKIRGQRIELDEIGITLSQHPAVRFAVVTTENAGGPKAGLVAYVLVAENSPLPAVSDLQEFLQGTLPSYMVPGTFLRLSKLPLSASGKLDLAKLPEAVIDSLPGRAKAKTPANAIELKLLGLVQEVLQDDSVGANDNFFLAGGHSLLGMQLIMRLRATFGVDLTLRHLFESPTVEGLALVVEVVLAQERLLTIWKAVLGRPQIGLDVGFEELGTDERDTQDLQRRIHAEFGRYLPKIELIQNQTIRKQAALLYNSVRENQTLPQGVVALQSEGEGNGIFWLHYPCLNLAKALGEDRPFLCLLLTAEDLSALGSSPTLQEVARCLVPKIVAAQPQSPYILGGYCLGGILSYEVACQMQAAGHEISHLVLLDTPSPEYYRPARFRSLMQRPGYLTRRVKQLGLRRTAFNLLSRAARRLPINAETEVLPPLDERVQSMLELAASRYKPSIFDGKAALIMASELPPDSPPHDDFLPWWRAIIRQEVQTRFVPALHPDLIKAPAVFRVAEAISSHLAAKEEVAA